MNKWNMTSQKSKFNYYIVMVLMIGYRWNNNELNFKNGWYLTTHKRYLATHKSKFNY